MKKRACRMISVASLSLLLLVLGCESERIVESTEYIERIEYINQPPDTVLLVDSIVIYDSTFTNSVDTVIQTDTVIQSVTFYDTVVQQVFSYDTVVQQVLFYDTTLLVDTVLQAQSTPNEHLAFAALQFYADDEVLAFINQEFGINNGWMLYLSSFQVIKATPSAGSYQFSGVIDYWTTDWQQYFPLEFSWVLVHTGGDPTNLQNWRMDEPVGVSSGRTPGLHLIAKESKLD